VKRGAKNGGGLALPPANVGIAHLFSQPSLLSGLRTPMCGATIYARCAGPLQSLIANSAAYSQRRTAAL
jgi:hypothetical protein